MADVGVRITTKVPAHGHNDQFDGGILKNTGGYNDDTIFYHSFMDSFSDFVQYKATTGTIEQSSGATLLTPTVVANDSVGLKKDVGYPFTSASWNKGRKFKIVAGFSGLETWIVTGGLPESVIGAGFGKPQLAPSFFGFYQVNDNLFGIVCASGNISTVALGGASSYPKMEAIWTGTSVETPQVSFTSINGVTTTTGTIVATLGGNGSNVLMHTFAKNTAGGAGWLLLGEMKVIQQRI